MLDDTASLYELFHENSKLDDISEVDMAMRIAALYEDPLRLDASRCAVKVYPYAPRIELPAVPELDQPGEPLPSLLRRRRSTRQFRPEPVTISALSMLLQYSYGITGSLKVGGAEVQKLRAAPSAGALYPLEVYPVVLTPGPLAAGVYHYNVGRHCLELVRDGHVRPAIIAAMPAQFALDTAALVLVLSASFGKTTHKYGERGYRFALLDAGHAMQNICLLATALDLGCYTVGGFRDDEIDALLGLDGVGERSLYTAVIGARVIGGSAGDAGDSER